MRILVAVLLHETNTLTPLTTSHSDFDVALGAAMLSRLPVRDIFREAGATIVPTIYASALPSGPVQHAAFHDLTSPIVSAAEHEGPFDGVWLYLHGAMEVEGLGSGEAWLVSQLRRVLGPNVPVAVALDFHANLTETLVRGVNVIRGYRTAPHTDQVDTQNDAARLLLRCFQEGLRPHPVMVRVPMMSPGDALVTTIEPGRTMMDETLAAEQQPGVLSASLFGGQPWVDAPNVGLSVVVTPTGEHELARQEANRIARLCWERRYDIHFEAETAEPEETLRRAAAATAGPVFISDSGDNTTGGAPGDDAGFLGLMLEMGVQNALVAGITDAAVVAACHHLPLGTQVKTRLGGTLAPGRSTAIEITGTLKHSGTILGWSGEDAGRCVVLAHRGVDVLVTARRCGVVSPEIMKSAGVDPLDYRLVVVKLGYLWDALRPLATRAIIALTPGATCEALEKVPYHRLRRPIYPLDKDFEWGA
jgi:microcystin degradation protein MlrC